MTPEDILHFWFAETKPEQWFKQSNEYDQLIKTKFTQLHNAARQCELYHWRATAEGRLAEIIILDQFSRNLFRGLPQAFVSDALALALAQTAVMQHDDTKLDKSKCGFLYMPFMHSESAAIHQVAVDLFTQLGDKDKLDYEYKHKAIIDRFGRYPHRNKILGRKSTVEEITFLKEPGSSF